MASGEGPACLAVGALRRTKQSCGQEPGSVPRAAPCARRPYTPHAVHPASPGGRTRLLNTGHTQQQGLQPGPGAKSPLPLKSVPTNTDPQGVTLCCPQPGQVARLLGTEPHWETLTGWSGDLDHETELNESTGSPDSGHGDGDVGTGDDSRQAQLNSACREVPKEAEAAAGRLMATAAPVVTDH